MDELIDPYIATILPRNTKALKTRNISLVWSKHIGHLRIKDVTLPSYPKYAINYCDIVWRKPRTPATVNRYTAVLRHLFTVASKNGKFAEKISFSPTKIKKNAWPHKDPLMNDENSYRLAKRQPIFIYYSCTSD